MKFNLSETPVRTTYNLINGLVAPRPIAWVTTKGPDGRVNAAPFSAFNYLCLNPPILGFGVAARPDGSEDLKDTARNIESTKEFVVNVVTEYLGEKMNLCGVDFPPGVDELQMAGLATEDSTVVKPPRIREAHAAMECRLYQVLKPGPTQSRIILGEVVAIYVEDKYIDPKGPYIKAEDLHAIGRMNGLDNYVRTQDAFIHIKRMNYADWQKAGEAKPGL